MQDLPNLFWPIPRDVMLATNQDYAQLCRLRSLITYQLLFGGKLVIRDSDYLNCLGLRRSIIRTINEEATDDEQFLRAALDLGFIQIAFRREQSLSQTATRLGQRGGAKEIGPELYSPTAPDLDYIRSTIQPRSSFSFSLMDAGRYYTEQTTKILSESLSSDLPNAIREVLLARVLEASAEGPIAWEFLAEDGGIWA